MKKLCKTLALVALAALTFGGTLSAEERGRVREMRGTFVRLVEQQVNEQGCLGIVIKPSEGDQVTVLIPPENEDLRAAARQLRGGQALTIAFAGEGPNNWLRRLQAGRQRDPGQASPEGRRRTAAPGEVRRDPAEPGPRPDAARQPADGNVRRDRGPAEQNPEARRDRAVRSPEEQERLRVRPPREGIGPVPGPEPMEAQIRDVVVRHAEQMSRALREVLRTRMMRMEAELRELRGRAERMEREMQALRAENERLKMQLRNRNEPPAERQRAIRERANSPRPREGNQPQEGEPQRDSEPRREPAPTPR